MQFDKIKVGQSLKRKREEIGLTQLALAIKMCVSESTVKKWEQGKRTPQLPDWLSLASILKTNVSTLIGEIEVKEMKNILEDFIIINQEAKDAEFFGSYEDVLEAWDTYYRAYDKMVNDENIDFIEWEENNNFIVLIESTTRNVYAIRDYGRYSLDPDDILFQTKYIPIFTHQPESRDGLIERVNRIVEMLQNEISGMFRTSRKPLFLLRYCGKNNYIAWSLAEKKLVCVYGYKKYRNSFGISEFDNYDVSSIKTNEAYTIVPPSENIIREMGLELYSDIWERKMRWDVWEPREEKIAVTDISSHYKEIYNSAISVINKGRVYNYELDDSFAKLERRVERFEKLSKLRAPTEIMKKEVKMINEPLLEISNALNINGVLETISEYAIQEEIIK